MSVLTIRHDTTYRHTAPAAAAWQAVRLMPRDEPAQECLAFDLDITPHAGDMIRRADYFGNTTHLVHVREQHTELAISATSVVRRRESHLPLPGLTPTIEAAVRSPGPTTIVVVVPPVRSWISWPSWAISRGWAPVHQTRTSGRMPLG